MLKFDEKSVLDERENELNVVSKTEALVDALPEIENIFYIGIGGTVLAAQQMQAIVKEAGSRLPLYVENAANFTLLSHPFFGKNSLVVIESASGDTKEVVEAVDKAKESGARVLGFIEKENSPLSQRCDDLVLAKGGATLFWYTITLRLMHNRGDFPWYDRFMEALRHWPENYIEVSKNADAAALAYAQTYCDEPLTYIVASGNLEGYSVIHGMCVMEEMQWMPTHPTTAADFFHGTLEVITRDETMLLMKGEDKTRPQMERVEAFARTICDNVIVFDTKDYALKNVDEELRGLFSPLVMQAICRRMATHLENERKHPLGIRRYYRALEY